MTKDLLPKDAQPVENSHLFPPIADESRLLIACRSKDYSASIIARAIEDCDAQVVNLNVTSLPASEGDVIVAVRVTIRNTDSIARSLSRFGYEVIEASSPESPDDERLRLRAAEILRYLEM